MFINLCGAIIGILAIDSSIALTLQISEDGNKIGKTEYVYTKRGEKLSSIAKRYGISFADITEANPTLTSKKTLAEGTRVAVPKYFPLPAGPREGIILNLANLRIYYFHPDGVHVSTYPVAAGKQGWSTPQGETTIVAKEKNPAWRPPASIRREAARRGRNLPLVIAPGPRNPLGRYAMRLGFGGILIHGTNQPQSIGTRASHGCIRMLAKDIEDLFKQVPVGTPVRIVHQTKSSVAAPTTASSSSSSSMTSTSSTSTTASSAKTSSIGAMGAPAGISSNEASDATNGIRIPPAIPVPLLNAANPRETAIEDANIKIPNAIPGTGAGPSLGPESNVQIKPNARIHVLKSQMLASQHKIPYKIDLCYKCTYVNAWLSEFQHLPK